jgi:sterol desaturase/sphingolipid hydroxylase (fatty acid hydroxylase superfamily)
MFVIDNEIYLRLGFFFAIFISMALWELTAPRRILTTSKGNRWIVNLSITIINAFVVRLIFPIAAIGIAITAQENGWGISNILGLNHWLFGITAILILDLVIYLQHVAFHHIPIFWRLHMVHHTDLDIDVTTGARFHPVEILLSMSIKILMIVIIGVPAYSVLAFEILLNGTSMFNHSNIFISPKIDKVLRLLVVTPDMHRVHHSVIIRETNSNFGFNFPWWDRIFGTYKEQPTAGHKDMKIGLANFRDSKRLTLAYILTLPVLRVRK